LQTVLVGQAVGGHGQPRPIDEDHCARRHPNCSIARVTKPYTGTSANDARELGGNVPLAQSVCIIISPSA
ncbi:MAG: hypothetical protein ACK55A_08150, partial [Gemmatimonas sp.]